MAEAAAAAPIASLTLSVTSRDVVVPTDIDLEVVAVVMLAITNIFL